MDLVICDVMLKKPCTLPTITHCLIRHQRCHFPTINHCPINGPSLCQLHFTVCYFSYYICFCHTYVFIIVAAWSLFTSSGHTHSNVFSQKVHYNLLWLSDMTPELSRTFHFKKVLSTALTLYLE
jgi:hypothetical protein